MLNRFTDRQEAGKLLAEQLEPYTNRPDVIVLGLARGGVPVAYEIAKALAVPLDIFVVRKLGVPHDEEFAMGAIAPGDTVIFNDEVIEGLYIGEHIIKQVIQQEKEELERREHLYRGDLPPPDIIDKTVILVDDGIATGASIRAAIAALDKQHPTCIIVATPVAAASICDEIARLVNTLICPLKPDHFDAVGQWYTDFPQVTDNEVIALLAKARKDK